MAAPKSRIQEVLDAMPGTVEQIMAATGMAARTVRRHVAALHADGRAHVKRRLRTHGPRTPVWEKGEGPDAPLPKRRTHADHCKEFRRRVKRAIERAQVGGREDSRYIRHIALHIAKKTAEKTREEPQTPFSALFAVAGARHA
jgi:predicted ArsR family transcriptional regulator